MSKKTKRIILVAGVVILIIVVCWVVIYNYKCSKSPNGVQGSETEKPPSNSFPSPHTVILNDIPTKREPPQLTREQLGRSQRLSSEEEKMIIKSLQTPVSINKEKSLSMMKKLGQKYG